MNLTPHFTLAELTVSQTAARLGYTNEPTAQHLINLKRLAVALEEVRNLVNGPIVVSSGYRSPAVNRAVGGSQTSAHMHGLAADINRPGLTPRQLARRIADSDIEFDQLILEFDAWVHFGLSIGKPRRQILTIRHGTGYLPGLV